MMVSPSGGYSRLMFRLEGLSGDSSTARSASGLPIAMA